MCLIQKPMSLYYGTLRLGMPSTVLGRRGHMWGTPHHEVLSLYPRSYQSSGKMEVKASIHVQVPPVFLWDPGWFLEWVLGPQEAPCSPKSSERIDRSGYAQRMASTQVLSTRPTSSLSTSPPLLLPCITSCVLGYLASAGTPWYSLPQGPLP